MVQTSDIEEVSSSTSTPALSTPKRDITDKSPADNDYTNYPTESVAAVTIAVLAVVIVLTMVLVFRALRKRQRARQGEQFGEGHIPTITTGVMGTGKLKFTVFIYNDLKVQADKLPLRFLFYIYINDLEVCSSSKKMFLNLVFANIFLAPDVFISIK
jgi:hypothetical protein